MPLRNHFFSGNSPTIWQAIHGQWPGEMVRSLNKHLPRRFRAAPRVYLGSEFELDVNAYDEGFEPLRPWTGENDGQGGLATATRIFGRPTKIFDADLKDEFEYEMHIYDKSNGETLVAAVEIYSPANKDRPSSREAFVAKCRDLLQRGVCVSIVDLVVNKRFNVFAELLAQLGQKLPPWTPKSPAAYAVTIRRRPGRTKSKLDVWAHTLKVGKQLPTLPV